MNTQQTIIATYRLNRPRCQFSEELALFQCHVPRDELTGAATLGTPSCISSVIHQYFSCVSPVFLLYFFFISPVFLHWLYSSVTSLETGWQAPLPWGLPLFEWIELEGRDILITGTAAVVRHKSFHIIFNYLDLTSSWLLVISHDLERPRFYPKLISWIKVTHLS